MIVRPAEVGANIAAKSLAERHEAVASSYALRAEEVASEATEMVEAEEMPALVAVDRSRGTAPVDGASGRPWAGAR